MKIESLNAWGGRLHGPLMEHLSDQVAGGVDAFCFQEVYDAPLGHTISHQPEADLPPLPITDLHPGRADLYGQLQTALPNYYGSYCTLQTGIGISGPVGYDLCIGIASFVAERFAIQRSGDVFIAGERDGQVGSDYSTMGRSLQYAQIFNNDRIVTIANVHGIWDPRGKIDTPERLEQSRRILTTLTELGGDAVVCGDLNLEPNTESIAMLEKAGLHNLVTEYGVFSTRSALYSGASKFGSYILTGSDIIVRDFRVLSDEVSDHLALEVEIE